MKITWIAPEELAYDVPLYSRSRPFRAICPTEEVMRFVGRRGEIILLGDGYAFVKPDRRPGMLQGRLIGPKLFMTLLRRGMIKRVPSEGDSTYLPK